jgi:hypothetical protein
VDAISDPGRPSRRDRRRAQKLVDTAFAEQRLTAADRSLRTQRIEAAHTRGDLAMITRDLVAPSTTNLGRALDPGVMSSMRRTVTHATAGSPTTLRSSTPTIDLSGVGRKVRLFILIAVGGMVASCLLGLVAFVPVVIGAFEGVKVSPADDATSVAPGPGAAPGPGTSSTSAGDPASLHSAVGWTQLVHAIEAESGTSEVYDVVAYPQYASVGLDGDGAVERGFYRDGAWQESVSMRMPVTGSLVDLAEIDADLIARLPQETARAVGFDQLTGTYIIVNAFAGDPRIMVYVQSHAESQYRVYRLDGTPMT